MSSLLVAPENETFPNRKRWTREECYDLMESGKLMGRWELIDGEIISKMGQKPPHAVTLQMISVWLSQIFGPAFIRIQSPITIEGEAGVTNEPEPDIAVTRQSFESYAHSHPTPKDLHLIVEISDTTLRFDLGMKAKLYASCGVGEYWVADVSSRKVHLFRDAQAGSYSETTILTFPDDRIRTLARPESSVVINEFFPTDK